MRLTLQPRLQRETWSLYWKEASRTATSLLAPVEVELDSSATVASMMDQLAAQLGWPPEDGLARLEGFKEPWQRALCRGRLLPAAATLAAAGLREGDAVTVVRVQLVAEGWRINDQFSLSDSEDEEDSAAGDE